MKRLWIALPVIAAAVLLAIPGASLYYESGGGAACARCHEIEADYKLLASSSHRSVTCEQCHGGALTLDAGFHMNNMRRVYTHLRGEVPDNIRLRNVDVQAMVDRCRACHRQEFADWEAGPHSASYSRIFLDRTHNGKELLMDDCLRCHGMHFEGGVRDLVTPVNTKGPWRLLPSELQQRPAMPCLTCHQMHRQGPPLQKSGVEGRVAGPAQEINRPSLAFFDRRTQQHVSLARLPLPAMKDGDRAVRMSPDQRQTLCYQCHAPDASMQIGTGDDRTGMGVHEGLSCLACHLKHGQKTRASCANCHPRLSNCGIDVEKMDTTFRSADSKHNVHWVKCVDCHPKGIPKKKVV